MKNFVVRQQDCCKSGNILILVCLYFYLYLHLYFLFVFVFAFFICSYKYKRNRTVVSGKSFWEPVKVFAFKENIGPSTELCNLATKTDHVRSHQVLDCTFSF